MANKKIVIPANNTKAIAFFEEIKRKKAETFTKIDEIQVKKLAELKR